jgi:hypothetical protein
MSKRMPQKPAKSISKTRAIAPMSPAMHADMMKVANVAASMSQKEEAAQQAARKAIVDTIEEWIAFLAENHPEAVVEFYSEISMLATTTNRRRIAKHALMPDGIAADVEETLRVQKEAEALAGSVASNGSDSTEQDRVATAE